MGQTLGLSKHGMHRQEQAQQQKTNIGVECRKLLFPLRSGHWEKDKKTAAGPHLFLAS
jgi:hypothetical protein